MSEHAWKVRALRSAPLEFRPGQFPRPPLLPRVPPAWLLREEYLAARAAVLRVYSHPIRRPSLGYYLPAPVVDDGADA